MPRELTRSELQALEDFLVKRFRAIVVAKTDLMVMQAVALAFGVIGLFVSGLPSSTDFLSRWATTLGPVVWMPTGERDPLGRLILLGHELGHVADWWADPVGYVRRYVGSTELRAKAEAQAERRRIEVQFLLTGTLPTVSEVRTFCEHGYAVPIEAADLGEDLVEMAATSTSAGVIATDVGQAVRDWLREHVS